MHTSEIQRKRLLSRRLAGLAAAGLSLASLVAVSTLRARDGDRDDGEHARPFRGRIVAVGIPGASTITPVGQFLPGGPIHDKPALAAFTQPGRILDPVRILVGSSSNFGAALARTDERPGSFLSIDPQGETLVIPEDFASAGGQASTLSGR